MTEIRPFVAGDLPGVARLFLEAFPSPLARTPEGVAAEFRRIYLEHPWSDSGVPSILAERDGDVIGFIGAIPMPMRLGGHPVRVAVGGNLMASPTASDPMATIRMLRTFFAGPQDLTLTDTASLEATKLWTGLGGRVCRFGSMRWVAPLRPAAMAMALGFRNHPVLRRVGGLVAAPVDAIAQGARRRGRPDGRSGSLRHIDADELLHELGRRKPSRTLGFDGDPAAFRWLVDNVARKRQFGPLRPLAFDGDDGVRRGAALYYPNHGDLGQVLCITVEPGWEQPLLDALFADARAQGSVALSGQVDPALFDQLGGRSVLHWNQHVHLTVHAKDRSLVEPIVAGDIGVSRLFADWWTPMQGDDLVD